MQGWLMDLWSDARGVWLWFYEGSALHVPYGPTVYAVGSPRALRRLRAYGEARQWWKETWLTRKKDFWAQRERTVMALRLREPRAYRALQEWAERVLPRRELEIYHLEFPVVQHFLLEYDLFPGRLTVEPSGVPRMQEDRWALDYEVPPFRAMTIRPLRSSLLPPGPQNPLLLEMEGEEVLLEERTPEAFCRRLREYVERWDPDIVYTEGGDGRLFRWLFGRRRLTPLDRVPGPPRARREGQSWVSYGRIVYRSPEFPLYGRWHMDRENTFLLEESDLVGVLELARLAGMRVPEVARAAIGSVMSMLQIRTALREGYLLPPRKQQVEEWKTAEQLLTVDKGGLYFRPPVGVFTDVLELDFSQMYPTIMVRHNISPERLQNG